MIVYSDNLLVKVKAETMKAIRALAKKNKTSISKVVRAVLEGKFK